MWVHLWVEVNSGFRLVLRVRFWENMEFITRFWMVGGLGHVSERLEEVLRFRSSLEEGGYGPEVRLAALIASVDGCVLIFQVWCSAVLEQILSPPFYAA